jgi:phospholipase C
MSAWLGQDGTQGGTSTKTLTYRVPQFGKFTWRTYPEVLQDAGVSWKVYSTADGNYGDNVLTYFKNYGYQSPDPTNPLYANAFLPQYPTDFMNDCAAGTLPQVSWVLGSLVQSDHPPAPPASGEYVLSQVINALTSSPLWSKSALFFTYDENGGFFDHVPPPTAPPGTTGEYITALGAIPKDSSGTPYPGPIGLGFRVPLLVVSPLSRGGLVSSPSSPTDYSRIFDHTSLLRFCETWLKGRGVTKDVSVPNLTRWRRRVTGDLTTAFNFVAPNQNVPTLPATSPNDPITVQDNCPVIAISLVNETVTEATVGPYPFPSTQSVPSQDSGTRPQPSGVCAASTSPSPSPAPLPPAILPNTAAGLSTGLAALLGGLALAGAWWMRRVAAPALDRPGSIGAGKAPPP